MTCKCESKFRGVWIAMAVIFVVALASCGGPPGPAEFRDNTCNGVIIDGAKSTTCPTPSFVGPNPTNMRLEIGSDADTLWASAWFEHDPIHRAPVPDTLAEATYSQSLGGGVIGRVAEFGEINGNPVVSAVDIEDGSFTANFTDNTGVLRLIKPEKDYAYAVIEIDVDMRREGPHYVSDGGSTSLTISGTNVSGGFNQEIADSSPRHPPWKSGGPTWLSSRTGVVNIGVDNAE